MAESTLSVIYADLVADLERYYGIAAGTETALIDRILRAGCRKFYAAHDWKFLRPLATLSTVAPYSTGTIQIVAGVVTLTGGTFPAWAASGVLVTNNVTYEIATRDGNTQVTLEDTSVDLDAGQTYELCQYAYDLPDNFGQLLGPMTYHPGLNQGYRPLTQIEEIDLRTRRQYIDESAPPEFFAVRQKPFVAATGLRYEVLFEPLPDDVYQFTYRYRFHPNKLATSEYPIGGMLHAETVRLGCLAAAEADRNDQAGSYMQQFMAQLAISIQRDNELHAPQTLGRMLDPCEAYDVDSFAEVSRIDRGEPYTP